MEKLKFEFVVKQAADGKSNMICINSIATPDGRVFEMPPEFQPADLHHDLKATPNYTKVKKSLTKRHQIRRIWINLTDKLSNTYLDEEENLQFNEVYLEDVTETLETAGPIPSGSNQTLEKLLEKLLGEKQRKLETRNLGKIASDFMLAKFTGRNLNANQWIENFNKECERFQIDEDLNKIKILKHFLDNSASEWYSCMLIKLTVESEWNAWEQCFRETFENKGWSPIRYALAFKYQAGSLLEYAIKKEKLLLEVRKSIDIGTLIDLIAFGLPNFVADKINRGDLEEIEDLYSELGRLEHLVGKAKYEKKYNTPSGTASKHIEEKKPCSICFNERKGKRYHPEENCWFKGRNGKTIVKTVNNSELEIDLNRDNPKN